MLPPCSFKLGFIYHAGTHAGARIHLPRRHPCMQELAYIHLLRAQACMCKHADRLLVILPEVLLRRSTPRPIHAVNGNQPALCVDERHDSDPGTEPWHSPLTTWTTRSHGSGLRPAYQLDISARGSSSPRRTTSASCFNFNTSAHRWSTSPTMSPPRHGSGSRRRHTVTTRTVPAYADLAREFFLISSVWKLDQLHSGPMQRLSTSSRPCSCPRGR